MGQWKNNKRVHWTRPFSALIVVSFT